MVNLSSSSSSSFNELQDIMSQEDNTDLEIADHADSGPSVSSLQRRVRTFDEGGHLK